MAANYKSYGHHGALADTGSKPILKSMTICHAIFHVHTLFFCYITNACIHDITRPIVQQTNCMPIG